jgi:hypothetical protein
MAAAAAAVAATWLASTTRPSSQCEKATKATTTSPLLEELFPSTPTNNPLWPGGCREQDVDAFVDQILQDPSINIPGIPDAVERLVYKSTIRLVLNIFYWGLSKLHGFTLLDHEIVLQVERNDTPLVLGDWKTYHSGVNVQDEVLEMVADRLLVNQAVNASLVPDSIERPLYINSLRLVFRLLDILTASFRLKVCGHELLLDLVPQSYKQQPRGNVLATATSTGHTLSSSLTRIDLDKIRQVARRHAGIRETDKSQLSLWQQISVQDEFLAQLHACIYALILGIADDVLANTEISLLSDNILLDLVPAKETNDSMQRDLAELERMDTTTTNSGAGGFHATSFLMGCGVGLVAAVAALVAGKN